ncbi:alpha/beta hydrolase fold-3 domain-containing protein [Talaromyces proteolyticus]|uniref:Alpha/beta hydrolase fold-3 domain-containing protein n=1 Tax=Talaromyces proteolyticus TaxID=1131652 RepID=A0AAD4KXW1_9EURO|nr:alpha/beta hydrolase fold-3 domain-containing protein [Talaromyces proteolyticus]KAH8702280.1 alpha/beta hydrolase fold-3 domain-containing protein [Talaromyces proteolyticus]
MADYSHFGIPPKEWADFLDRTGPLAQTTIERDQTIEDLQRKTNESRDAVSARFMTSGLSDKIHWVDYDIPTRDGETITARAYEGKYARAVTDSRLPVYLFFHGGGFLFGTLSSEDATCARIASELPIIVVNVCYRHTPQFKHPTQVYDAQDAFYWVSKHMDDLRGDPEKLIVGGVSAGASLAATLTIRENRSRDKKKILGQVLCIPWLSHPDIASKKSDGRVGSYSQNECAPILPRVQIEFFTRALSVEDPKDKAIFASNADDDELMGMPKTLMLVCGRDVLRDEGLDYAERLRNLGVPTKLTVFSGLPHGFQRYLDLPSTSRWFETINQGLEWILSEEAKI